MAQTFELPSSWAEKIVNLHLRAAGLRGDHFLSKYNTKLHCAILVFIVMFVCQEVYGVFIRLTTNEYSLDNIILPLHHVSVTGSNFVLFYITVYTRPALAACIRDSTQTLNCSAEVDIDLLWRNHTPLFKFFFLIYVLLLYLLTLLMSIISPLGRFVFKTGPTWYVLYPNWYPVDVLSNSTWFWTACLYEALVSLYTLYMFAVFNTAHLYLVYTTRVRFDALSLFCARITCSSSSTRTAQSSLEEIRIRTRRIFVPSFLFSRNMKSDSGASLERLKRGMEDLNVLRRQKKLIDHTFKQYFDSCHFVSAAINISSAFTAAYWIRNSNKKTEALAESFVFFFFLLVSLSSLFTVCHNATLLHEAQENLRSSLWECNWLKERAAFKKLFFHSKVLVNRPMKTMEFSLFPVNLENLTQNLSISWSYFLFLYQLSLNIK